VLGLAQTEQRKVTGRGVGIPASRESILYIPGSFPVSPKSNLKQKNPFFSRGSIVAVEVRELPNFQN